MKLKNYLLAILFLLGCNSIIAQEVKTFSQRLQGGNLKIKGDVVLIGNASIGRSSNPNGNYTGNGNNNGTRFSYIDVDTDATTFSSSTANLAITSGCKKIVYAGLYWSATYPNDILDDNNYIGTPRQPDWNQVKFKVPGGTYQTLVADDAPDLPGDEDDIIINGYDYYPLGSPLGHDGTRHIYGAPYVCYKNITKYLTDPLLLNVNGTYAVANQRVSTGLRADGNCGGWTMVVIYEDSTLPSKFISVYDGYSNIDTNNRTTTFSINGFNTLPVGPNPLAPLPVNARVGVSALEGDRNLTGDYFTIEGAIPAAIPEDIANTLNPSNNVFNSSVTTNNVSNVNRSPASTNLLGYDIDIIKVVNNNNTVIPNNETGATLKATTNGEGYSIFLTTFDVEIIEPVIQLTKEVRNNAGALIGNTPVTLDTPLNYFVTIMQ
jgi:hypothetical protein